MLQTLAQISTLIECHFHEGRKIASGDIFPADALALAALNRSLALMRSFDLLMRNEGYIAAGALLRMQLDNAIRLHGIFMLTENPHAIADQMFGGKKLDSMKSRDGNRLQDKVLRDEFVKVFPWADIAYRFGSDFVHLSGQHIVHFVKRSPLINSGQGRSFTIGDDDAHVSDGAKISLAENFELVTRSVLEVVRRWELARASFGSAAELRTQYRPDRST